MGRGLPCARRPDSAPPEPERPILRVPSGAVIDGSDPRARSAALPSAAGQTFARFLATAGGAGHMPIAPGTFGSAVGVAAFVLFAPLPAWLYGLSVLALLAAGTWAADVCEQLYGKKDDGRIVVDEVVGQLIALAPLLAVGHHDGVALAPWLVTGFVAFRLFDIWKPGPVRWAERNLQGGAGVMMDDVVAGAMAAMVVLIGLLLAGPAGPTGVA